MGHPGDRREKARGGYQMSALASLGPYIVAGSYGVFRTMDHGETWTLVPSTPDWGGIWFLLSNRSILYAGTWKGVFTSADSGATWSPSFLDNHGAWALGAIDSNVFFSTGSGLFRTSNSGTTWDLVNSTSYAGPIVSSGPLLFVGYSAMGVFVSSDRGGSWRQFIEGMENLDIALLAANDRFIFAATHGGYLFRRTISDATGVSKGPSNQPAQLRLLQNYPNPFNPATTIRYELPKSTTVLLKIFNALGQEVALLVNEHKKAGYYQATWNANVPSGIYFYRLHAGEYAETKKMILLSDNVSQLSS